MNSIQECPIFKERDRNLRLLGFIEYSAYLSSDLWSFVRSNLTDPAKCVCCNSKSGLAWHHRSYALPVLVGNFSETSSDIVRICGNCHLQIHTMSGEGKEWFFMDVVNVRLESLMHIYRTQHMSTQEDTQKFISELPTTVEEASRFGFDEFLEYSQPSDAWKKENWEK